MTYPNPVDPDGPEQAYRAWSDGPVAEKGPGFFSGWDFSRDNPMGPMGPPVRAAGEGAGEVAQAALGGVRYLASLLPAELEPNYFDTGDPIGAMEAEVHKHLQGFRPDPKTTGMAANLVQGVGSVVTAATGAALLAPEATPAMLAPAIGAITGFARYKDLRDENVDEQTAAAVGMLDGSTNALGMVMPAGLPAKWLADLGKVPAYLAQMAVGAAGQVGLGAASRFGVHAIFEANGYPELAAQAKVWDGEAMAADAILGTAFGWMHGFSTEQHREFIGQVNKLRDAVGGDRNLEDAARTVLTSYASQFERAPGVPADAATAALHARMLDKAMSDVLVGREGGADVSHVLDREPTQQLAFLVEQGPEPVEERQAREIMAEEFAKSGVLGKAPVEEAIAVPTLPEPEAKAPEPEAPKAAAEPAPTPAEPAEAEPEQRIATDKLLRSALEGYGHEAGWAEVGGKHGEEMGAGERTSWVPKAPWWPGRPTDAKGKGLNEEQTRTAITKALAGEKLGSRQQAMVDFLTKLHDEEREHEDPATTAALEQHPDLQITDEDGNVMTAEQAQASAIGDQIQAEREAEAAHMAAGDCWWENGS